MTLVASAATALVVREARPDELDAVGRLTRESFAAGPYGHLPISPERERAERDATWRARAGIVLVATEEREATGSVGGPGVAADAPRLLGSLTLVRAGAEGALVARADELEVRFLVVAPDARGRGVANALLDAALDVARAAGLSAVVLDTGAGNGPANRLYQRFGFERERDRDRVAPRVGRELVYRYDLEPAAGAVRVRLVRDEELDAVGELTERAYASDYELSEGYRATLRDVRGRARADEVWVAVDARTGELLGTVWTPRPGSTLSPVAREDEMDFRLLGVAPGARGRGIGELLVRHAIGRAQDRGAARVVLNTGPEMVGAHRLYERLGFEHLTEREGPTEVGPGVFVDLLAYGLAVDETGPVEEDARR